MTHIDKAYPIKGSSELIVLYYDVFIKQKIRLNYNTIILISSFVFVDLLRFLKPAWFKHINIEVPAILVLAVGFLFFYTLTFFAFALLYLFSSDKGLQINNSELLIYKGEMLKEKVSLSEITCIEFETFDIVIEYLKNNKAKVLTMYYPTQEIVEALSLIWKKLELERRETR